LITPCAVSNLKRSACSAEDGIKPNGMGSWRCSHQHRLACHGAPASKPPGGSVSLLRLTPRIRLPRLLRCGTRPIRRSASVRLSKQSSELNETVYSKERNPIRWLRL
jgi:hypothetical protein